MVKMRVLFTLAICATLVATTIASAQNGAPNLALRVASAGGGSVTAGDYTLTSSVGQHDAGAQAAGAYVVAGGVLVAKPGAGPPATPTPASQNWLPVITR